MTTHPTGLVEQTNDEYHSGPGISKSHLDTIWSGSPLHYWHKYLNPERVREEPTDDMIMGSAVHAAILEPETFTDQVVESPGFDRRTKAGRAGYAEFQAAHRGKLILDPEDFATCLAVRDAVHRHPLAGALLSASGRTETSFYAIDPETGELIKCRVDKLHADGGTVVDIKTTKNASPAAFGRSCADFRYPVQQAFYNRVFDTEFGEHPETWAFVAVEKKPPYAIGVYFVEPDVLARAEIAAHRDFMRIVECRRSGEWPDYGAAPLPMAIPNWSKF